MKNLKIFAPSKFFPSPPQQHDQISFGLEPRGYRTLEAGQDLAKTGDPVQSSKNFVGQLTTPDFPWTALTIALVIGVAAATAATRWLQIRGKRAAAAEAGATRADQR